MMVDPDEVGHPPRNLDSGRDRSDLWLQCVMPASKILSCDFYLETYVLQY